MTDYDYDGKIKYQDPSKRDGEVDDISKELEERLIKLRVQCDKAYDEAMKGI